MMDVATSLVQAYLHVNGYFTATNYPLVESLKNNEKRTLTDIDMMAVRFARHEHSNSDKEHRAKIKKHPDKVSGPLVLKIDPALGSSHDRTDMIVAEIKQGRAHVNPGSSNQLALAATLTRFGCCDSDEAPRLVKDLLKHGKAKGQHGHEVRMVLFASSGQSGPHGWHFVKLGHVFQFLNDYLYKESDVLSHVDLHDPALSWLSLLHKCDLGLQSKKHK